MLQLLAAMQDFLHAPTWGLQWQFQNVHFYNDNAYPESVGLVICSVGHWWPVAYLFYSVKLLAVKFWTLVAQSGSNDRFGDLCESYSPTVSDLHLARESCAPLLTITAVNNQPTHHPPDNPSQPPGWALPHWGTHNLQYVIFSHTPSFWDFPGQAPMIHSWGTKKSISGLHSAVSTVLWRVVNFPYLTTSIESSEPNKTVLIPSEY